MSSHQAEFNTNVPTPTVIPDDVLRKLSPDSRECIQRLLAYDAPPAAGYGIVKQAAVLVALFEVPQDGRLRVLLTTRAKTLRRHPGLTALPGGKVDPEDPSYIHTARREAFEEVGLPLSHSSIYHLTTLDPVMTILPLNAHPKNHIIVTPVVCLITDYSIIESLQASPDEVDYVFSHPLEDLHNGFVPDTDRSKMAKTGHEWWPYEEEHYSTNDRLGVTGWHRMHRFRTTHSPIKGLTADVLIHCATIAYAKPPTYGAYSSNQLSFPEAIANVVRDLPGRLEQDKINTIKGIVVPEARPEWGSGDGTTVASAEVWSTR